MERAGTTLGKVRESQLASKKSNANRSNNNSITQPTNKSKEAPDTVETVVNYLKSKLPASVAGQVDNALTGEGSSISERLGGILGKKPA